MELSLADARRIALAAQGFGRRPGKPTISAVRTVASKLMAIQLDSVNVLVRSHYLPAYSRLGPYPLSAIDKLAYDRRELFECWGKAACLLPVDLYPLLRYRMTAQLAVSPWTPGGSAPEGAYIKAVYEEVAARGPLAAGELSEPGRGTGKWWGWNNGKMALEHLLSCGLLAIAGRRGFTRLYDITERVIPPAMLDTPALDPEDAQRELICRSAKALGVASAKQLGGYLGLHSHRIVVRRPDGRRPRPIWPRLVDELVDEGGLVRVTVEGWPEPGYLVPGTRRVRTVNARALLSPFDTFMWGSAQLLCGFTNPLSQQLYVPAERRIYGYYVLPFLLGDTLVGRTDLKADRQRRALLVQSAYVEPGHDRNHVAAELAAELRQLQMWLELDTIEVADRGDLAEPLRSAMRH
jgi:hypothetical protein